MPARPPPCRWRLVCSGQTPAPRASLIMTSGLIRLGRRRSWACCRTDCACSTGSAARSCCATSDFCGECLRPRSLVRSAELLEALALADDRHTLVVEYSAGMTKKIGLACALIHAPRLLILDEPFEAVDPVSGEGFARSCATTRCRAERWYVQPRDGAGGEPLRRAGRGRSGQGAGGGTLDEVRAGSSLQQRFLDLVGFTAAGEESLAWLRSSSG